MNSKSVETNTIKVRERVMSEGKSKMVNIESTINVTYIQEDGKNIVAHCNVEDIII